ncbi:MAG: putative lipid II flippase FtsW [Eggerthellaceae bacterium]|jgi:cell division protein FtsW|nr:putative lipid II flippase FtsW [Eggerthellaceae bacterium]
MAHEGQSETHRRQKSSAILSGSRDIVIPRVILIVAVFALTVIGLMMVYSSSSIEAIDAGTNPLSGLAKQCGVTLFAIALCAVIARCIPYYVWLDKVLNVFWGISILLLILTMVMGTRMLGAQRWLVIGPINFQPSEFAKVVIVLTMARIVYKARTDNRSLGWIASNSAIYVLLLLLLIYVAQSDLGTTAICLVGILTVLILGDMPWQPLAILVAVICVLGFAAIFLVGYRSDRMAFLNPQADALGSGYQLIRSFYAFGSGGLFGVGIGNSTEKYLYLPESDTDFIFAILGEELGLVGAFVVIVLFVAILIAGFKIARKAPDMFGTMVAGGCTAMLVFQAFLNIGCVIGIFPTTGKPLPFISSGGSAMIGSYLLVAMILSVSFASGSSSGIFDRRRDDLRIIHADQASSSDRERHHRESSLQRANGSARLSNRQSRRSQEDLNRRSSQRVSSSGRTSNRSRDRTPRSF